MHKHNRKLNKFKKRGKEANSEQAKLREHRLPGTASKGEDTCHCIKRRRYRVNNHYLIDHTTRYNANNFQKVEKSFGAGVKQVNKFIITIQSIARH
jgi:hypothetical protein